MTKTPAATLTIGVTPLAGATATLAAALADLRNHMPRLEITVRTVARQQIAIAAARGELDLALTDGLTAPDDSLPEQVPVTAIGISEENVRVVLPAGHPLATRATVRLPDLTDARWIEADKVAPPLAEIRRHAGTEGFRSSLRYTGTDVMTLLNLATAGHGLTLLPGQVLSNSGITSVQVAQPRLTHRVELIHAALRPHSPAAALAAILSSS